MSRLELHGISHRYDEDPDVLTDVDLTVEDREMVAVVGPSGTGKSTLLRVAAGLVAAQRGRVCIDGADVTGTPTQTRDLTVMFQRPHLFDHLDVRGNVAFGPRVLGATRSESRARAERYLDLVQLEGHARRRPQELSGGQQQRVALARALACERGVLLLDEPFSSLDTALRAQMHELLMRVRRELSPTVLMVTHDLDEASLADRVAVLSDGTLQQVAPAPTLYAEPATLAVARLVGGFLEVPGRAERGTHRSAHGRVRLAASCRTQGEATLLIRREQLRIVPERDAAAEVGDPGGDVFQLSGTVGRTRLTGPRQTVTVDGDDGSAVDVELRPGRTASVGDRVVVAVAGGVRAWALPRD